MIDRRHEDKDIDLIILGRIIKSVIDEMPNCPCSIVPIIEEPNANEWPGYRLDAKNN